MQSNTSPSDSRRMQWAVSDKWGKYGRVKRKKGHEERKRLRHSVSYTAQSCHTIKDELILQSLWLEEIALCVCVCVKPPTVWIISLVNPFLKGGFAGRNTWIYCTVGWFCIHIHWLWPPSLRKRNINTLEWHLHDCKLTQSHQHYFASARKSTGLNHKC